MFRHRLTIRFWRTAVSLPPLFKRVLDIVVSASALLLASPVVAAIVLAIKLEDGGPVLFWQRRVGQYGREFRFPKFRSMVVNAEAIRQKLLQQNQHGEGVTFKMKNDPRITRTGRLMAQFIASLDADFLAAIDWDDLKVKTAE